MEGQTPVNASAQGASGTRKKDDKEVRNLPGRAAHGLELKG